MNYLEEVNNWINEDKAIDDIEELTFVKVKACIEKMLDVKEKELLSLEKTIKASSKIGPKDKKRLIDLAYNTFDDFIRDEFQ
jgi:hypothetical protein